MIDYQHFYYAGADAQNIIIEYWRAIDSIRSAHPNLKGIKFKKKQEDFITTAYLEEIFAAFNVENVAIETGSMPPLPANLWTKNLKSLSLTASWNRFTLDVPHSFENHLEILELNYIEFVPLCLLDTPTLRSVSIGSKQSIINSICKSLNINYLKIQDEIITQLPETFLELKHLKQLELYGCAKLEALPDFKRLSQLESLELNYLNSLPNLVADWDALVNLQSLTIRQSNWDGFQFKTLPKLRLLRLGSPNFAQANSIGTLPNLESLIIASTKATELPTILFQNSGLKYLELQYNQHLQALPAIFNFEKLNRFVKKSCSKLVLPAELLFCDLNVFDFDEYWHVNYRSREANHIAHYYGLQKWMHQLSKEVDTDDMLAVGSLLLTNLQPQLIADIPHVQRSLLRLLRLDNSMLNKWVIETIYFLNPDLKAVEFPKKPQSICLHGSTHKPKSFYKEKLIELGFIYHHTLRADTALVVVAGPTKTPSDFWNYPHLFFKEQDLELFLQDATPGFLQQDQETDTMTASLQALLWSGTAESDGLALQMMLSGGIPAALIPDVVMVVKMHTENENIHAGLKKLLQAQFPVSFHPFLTRINPPKRHKRDKQGVFERYQALQPTFDIVQMCVCYAMRSGYCPEDFFALAGSERHPLRNEMFKKYLKSYFSKMENVWLTAQEWQQILEIPNRRDHLKELNLQCLDAELPEALALCSHISVLTIKFKGASLPDCFGEWTALRSLRVESENLKSLSDSLLQLPKFKSLSLRVVNGGKPLTLSTAWKKLLDYNGIQNPIEWR